MNIFFFFLTAKTIIPILLRTKDMLYNNTNKHRDIRKSRFNPLTPHTLYGARSLLFFMIIRESGPYYTAYDLLLERLKGSAADLV